MKFRSNNPGAAHRKPRVVARVASVPVVLPRPSSESGCSPRSRRPDRRRLLRGAAHAGILGGLAGTAGLLAGCDVLGTEAGQRSEPPTPDPDLPLVRGAVGTTRDLLDRYEAVARRHPSLRETLAPYVGRHRRHLTALTDGSAGPRLSSGDEPPGSPTAARATSPPTRHGMRVPGSAPAAVRALVAHEEKAAATRLRALRSARNPELARLLASIGACESVHAIALADAAGESDG